MTQEDKQLLLKDLNARLPYGVYVEHTTTKIRGKLNGIIFEHIYNDTDSIQDINAWATFFGDEYVDATYFRPFLRPMSSMTEEEKSVLCNMLIMRPDFTYGIPLFKEVYKDKNWVDNWNYCSFKAIDWLNEHHLDYKGLIEKGLAIEVTNEDNPYE